METKVNEKPEEALNEPNNDKMKNKFIRCPDCGEEIRMVPTLAEMIEAIENHITIHREHSRIELTSIHKKTPCIREDLTEQVLQRAAEMVESPSKNSTWIKLE
jgi:hypothetical protein